MSLYLKKSLFLVPAILVWSLAAPIAAQNSSCKATLNTLPSSAELKGFRLGMTLEQVKAVVPTIIFGPNDDLGKIKTTYNPLYDSRADNTNFQDVRSISLEFLDGRLTSLWIGYEPNFKWTTVEEFVDGISRSLSLPSAWSTWKLRGKELNCADFQMSVSLIAQSPSFRILDRTAEESFDARRIAQEEAKVAAEEQGEPEEIVGDKKSKRYYSGDCRPEAAIPEADRIIFKTIADAEKAGYSPAKGCS